MKFIFLLVITCGCVLSNDIRIEFTQKLTKFQKEDDERIEAGNPKTLDTEDSLRRYGYIAYSIWDDFGRAICKYHQVMVKKGAKPIELPKNIEFEQITCFLAIMHVANERQLLLPEESCLIVEENMLLIRNSLDRVIADFKIKFNRDINSEESHFLGKLGLKAAKVVKRMFYWLGPNNAHAADGDAQATTTNGAAVTAATAGQPTNTATGSEPEASSNVAFLDLKTMVAEGFTKIDNVIYEMMQHDTANMSKIHEMYVAEIEDLMRGVDIIDSMSRGQEGNKSAFARAIKPLAEKLKSVGQKLNEILELKGEVENQVAYHYLIFQMERAYDFISIFHAISLFPNGLQKMESKNITNIVVPKKGTIDVAVAAANESLSYLDQLHNSVFKTIGSKHFDSVDVRLDTVDSFENLKSCRSILREVLSGIAQTFTPGTRVQEIERVRLELS